MVEIIWGKLLCGIAQAFDCFCDFSDLYDPQAEVFVFFDWLAQSDHWVVDHQVNILICVFVKSDNAAERKFGAGPQCGPQGWECIDGSNIYWVWNSRDAPHFSKRGCLPKWIDEKLHNPTLAKKIESTCTAYDAHDRKSYLAEEVKKELEGTEWKKIKNEVVQIFTVAVFWISFKTLALLFVFSHKIVFINSYIYDWVRNSGVGEITQMSGGFYRIFFQSHVFVLTAFVFFFISNFLLFFLNTPYFWSPCCYFYYFFC